MYSYDPETKPQSLQWKLPNSPWPKKARQVRSNVKSMLIFFFPTLKALSTRNSYPLVKPSMASFTVRFWSGWGNTSLVVCCSTIPDFQKHYSDPPTRLTSPPATFSYSPRWNYGWKGVVLTRLRRSMQKRKRLSTHSHLRTFRDAGNHGKHAGITVYQGDYFEGDSGN